MSALGIVSVAGSTSAQTPPTPVPTADAPSSADADTEEARRQFSLGSEHTKNQRWAEALAAFEKSDKLRSHPVTTYNVGYCRRALGRYLLAQRAFRSALEDNARLGNEMATELVDAMRTYVKEIDGLVARYAVTLAPPDAALTVDGAPLEVAPASRSGDRPTLLAGVLPAGEGVAPPAGSFDLVIEPGAHVMRIHRKGHATAVVKLDVRPGKKDTLALRADRLPATLVVTSVPAAAVVRIEGRDVGVTPVSLLRPPGAYRIEVEKPGFNDYGAAVRLAAGQEAAVEARLTRESVPLTSRWWFWTAAAAVTAGAVVTTYALTRPDPEPQPYSGGGLGWVVKIP